MTTKPEEAVDARLRMPDLGSLAASASGFSLVISVLYDFCYLHAMGLSLAEVPTTIADHVRSAIIWAPYLVAMAGGGVIYTFFALWSGVSSTPPATSSRMNRLLHGANRFQFHYVPPVLFILSAFIAGTTFSFVAVWAIAMWVIGGPMLLKAVDRVRKLSFAVWFSCYALPTIAAVICLLGHIRGTEMRDGRAEAWLVEVKDGDATKTIPTKGLRRFGESVVFVESDRRIRVLPASEVVSATTANIPPLAKRAVCAFLDVYCVPLSVPKAASAPK